MAKESTLTNMLLCLFLVALATSALLGGAYVLTYDMIEAAQKKGVNDAIAVVVPAFDNNPSDEAIIKEVDGKRVKIYPAYNNSVPVGYAIEASSVGFSGPILLMVGFLPDGSIHNIAVISHTETPGLGDKIEKKKGNFSIQFNGKNPADFHLSVKKDGGDVDAITASTITSRAFCHVVELAYNAFLTVQPSVQVQPNDEGNNYE